MNKLIAALLLSTSPIFAADLGLPHPEMAVGGSEDQPYAVDSKVYEKVRRHIEKYGGDDQTSDGNPAKCFEALGDVASLRACMNFASGAPEPNERGIIPAVLVTYTGPVEVTLSQKDEDGSSVDYSFFLTTGGKLAEVVEVVSTMPPTAAGDMKNKAPGGMKLKVRNIKPGSPEARESWDKMAETILSLVPAISI